MNTWSLFLRRPGPYSSVRFALTAPRAKRADPGERARSQGWVDRASIVS
jgi:hypothetical protein